MAGVSDIKLALELRAKKLTADELYVLQNSPYDAIGKEWPHSSVVRQLVKDKLLEENPTAVGCYRVTNKGEDVLRTASRMARKLR